jgi:dipeptidyl aminopeptidase/acylaminoacyl peptidase
MVKQAAACMQEMSQAMCGEAGLCPTAKHGSIFRAPSRVVFLTATILLAACQGSAATQIPTPLVFGQTLAPSGTTVNTSDAGFQATIVAPDHLDLTGSVIFVNYQAGVGRFDFSTRKIVPIFELPLDGSINSAVLSPDGRTLVMAYTAPPDPTNHGVVAFNLLYTLPANGEGEPTPLLQNSPTTDYFFAPWWTPDGHHLYFQRYINPYSGAATVVGPSGYFLARYAFPNGPIENLVPNVLMARISADGKRLFYVTIDLESTFSNIYLSDLDASNPKKLLPGGNDWVVDSLAVSPDGETVIYSSASSTTPIPTSSSWLNSLLGVSTAEAHNVISDLWTVKLGEAPRQLTHLEDYAFWEDFSPDGQHIIFSCGSGVYVMRPDGSELTLIIKPGIGSLQWVQ